jgi:NADPH-dependent curcumin reductase CurA
MNDLVNHAWRIARPIDGLPRREDFSLNEIPMPELGDGQVLMRNIYIGIAPGVRPLMPYAGAEPAVSKNGAAGRIDASGDDLPDPSHIAVGQRMRSGIVPSASPFAGGSVGQVVRSRHANFKQGDYIFGGRYWQNFEAVDGDASLRLDPEELPIHADLGLIGRSAFTAWVGWKRFCAGKPGETIVISAAGGAVGGRVVELAKAAGLRVIGIASGAEKCAYVVKELGALACIDRNGSDVAAELDRIAPAGVDIYFDNAGGLLMRPVFDRLKPFGRLIVCGMAAEYNGFEQSALSTGAILGKRLRIEGFVVLDHDGDYSAFREETARLWKAGALHDRHQIYEGLETAPEALAACLSGQHSGGKIFVQVSADTSRTA